MTKIVSEVAINLDGEHDRLIVGPRAAKEVTAYFGSYADAFRKIIDFDHNAYVTIVAAGTHKKRSDVENGVFRTGLDVLSGPLSEFVGLLSRGGRPMEADEEKGKAKPGEA